MTERTFKATKEELPLASEYLEELLTDNGCSMKVTMQLAVAFEEIFINVANYAYGDSVGEITIGTDIDSTEFTIVFSDCGFKFNPLEKDDPDITLSAEERNIGGLGIFMVKKIMDSVTYEYKDGKNILTLKKNFLGE